MNLLITQFSPVFPLLASKLHRVSSKPFVIHPQSVFFPYCERPSATTVQNDRQNRHNERRGWADSTCVAYSVHPGFKFWPTNIYPEVISSVTQSLEADSARVTRTVQRTFFPRNFKLFIY